MKDLREIYNSDQFNNIDFIANQLVEGFITGFHRSPYHGFSVELPNIEFITQEKAQNILIGNFLQEPKNYL